MSLIGLRPDYYLDALEYLKNVRGIENGILFALALVVITN
jgi:hypothetical protein